MEDSYKKKLIENIQKILKPNGLFILGDLMTYADSSKADLMNKKSESHLINNTTDQKIKDEWLNHWRELNILGTIEDHISWFNQAGFTEVKHIYQYLNTNLILGKKGVE